MRLPDRLYSLSPAFAPALVAALLAGGFFAVNPLDIQAVLIGATMTDALIVDNGDAGVGDPGDRIRYTTVITNFGDEDATDVVFQDSPEATSTLVPGSVKTTPIAVDDSYSSVGNVGISVPAGSGVLFNDNDPDGTGFAATPISAFDGTSTGGGSVSVNTADGSFTYTPPAGYQGTDTFTYTVDDGESNSDVATVSVAVGDMIWFIDNTAAGANDGRLNSPFTTLGAFEAVNGNPAPAPGTGDCIFLHDGIGSYSGGVTLAANQTLVGQGATSALPDACGITLPPFTSTVPATGGSKPTIENAGGDGITLASGNTVRGLSVNNTLGDGVEAVGVSTITLQNMVIGDPAASASDAPDNAKPIQGNGIRAHTVTGLAIVDVKIARTGIHGVHGIAVTNLSIDNAEILNAGDGQEENGVQLEGLLGDNLITNSLFDAFNETGIQASSTSDTFDLTISNTTFQDNTATVGNAGEEAILLDAQGTAVMTVLIDNCVFDDIALQHVDAVAVGTSIINVTVENSFLYNTSAGDAMIIVNPDGSASANTTINDNTFAPTPPAPFGILLKNDSSGRLDATIQGNTFTSVQPLSLNHDDTGSGTANGLSYLLLGGDGVGDGNTATNSPACCTGVSIVATENAGSDAHDPDVHVSLINNDLTGPTDDFPFTGIIDVNAFDDAQLNLDIRGNTATGPSEDFGGPSISVGYSSGGTFRIEGLTPSPGGASAFIDGQNTVTATTYDGGLTGYLAGNADFPTATTRPNPVLAPVLIAADVEEVGPTMSRVSGANPPSVAGKTVSDAGKSSIAAPAINIGTLPAGKSITIVFDYDLTNVSPPQDCNQGSVAGSNFATTLTDDPDDPTSSSDVTCTPVANPLPVELARFEARPDGNAIVLEWETASEENNAGFEVQVTGDRSQVTGHRSRVTGGWNALGFVEGTGTTHSPRRYSFRTRDLEPGIWNFRLKQVDYDGAFEYSSVVSVEIEVPHELSLSENYPNPFNPATRMTFSVPAEGRATVKVFTALGRQVHTLFDGEATPGTMYHLALDASELATGEYIYVLEHGGRSVSRKMVLMR